jgi:hypothetical protein
MLTTETPGAHEFNIASSAAMPPNAVPYPARRYGHDGTIDEAADDARQRALHSRNGDDRVRLGEQRGVIEQTMQTGDAAVVDALDAIAERFGDERGFFGDRKIGGAGGSDDDEADRVDGRRTHDDETREGVIRVRQSRRRHRGGNVIVRACREHVRVRRGEPSNDLDDLLGRLAWAEHRLGRAATQRAMQIDFREAEIVVRKPAESRERVIDGEAPRADVFENFSDRVSIHPRDARASARGWHFPIESRRDRP